MRLERQILHSGARTLSQRLPLSAPRQTSLFHGAVWGLLEHFRSPGAVPHSLCLKYRVGGRERRPCNLSRNFVCKSSRGGSLNLAHRQRGDDGAVASGLRSLMAIVSIIRRRIVAFVRRAVGFGGTALCRKCASLKIGPRPITQSGGFLQGGRWRRPPRASSGSAAQTHGIARGRRGTHPRKRHQGRK